MVTWFLESLEILPGAQSKPSSRIERDFCLFFFEKTDGATILALEDPPWSGLSLLKVLEALGVNRPRFSRDLEASRLEGGCLKG